VTTNSAASPGHDSQAPKTGQCLPKYLADNIVSRKNGEGISTKEERVKDIYAPAEAGNVEGGFGYSSEDEEERYV